MLRSVFLGLCGCLTLAASVACSSAASEEEELDEGALAERGGDVCLLESNVRDGLFPRWHGAGDKIWTANRRGPSFGLVGATPLYTAPAGASIEAMATTATGAKLLVTQQDQGTSLVSV